MKGPGQQNDFAKHSKEMTKDNIPCQYVNTDYGKKRKAKSHKFSIISSGTGKLYGSRAIKETFAGYLIHEAADQKMLERLTELPKAVIDEMKKLIVKGAKDINQQWEDAKELVDTAYHVARIRRPIPDQKKAWGQYTELLKFGVNQLWNTRGKGGDWRSADVLYREGHTPMIEPLTEGVGGKRFFVMISNVMDVEIDSNSMTDVIKELTNKIRRHGGHTEVRHRNEHGAVLVVWKNDEEIEEITIKMVS